RASTLRSGAQAKDPRRQPAARWAHEVRSRPMEMVGGGRATGSRSKRSSSLSILDVFALIRTHEEALVSQALQDPLELGLLHAEEDACLFRCDAQARHLIKFSAHTNQDGFPLYVGKSILAARTLGRQHRTRPSFKPRTGCASTGGSRC